MKQLSLTNTLKVRIHEKVRDRKGGKWFVSTMVMDFPPFFFFGRILKIIFMFLFRCSNE